MSSLTGKLRQIFEFYKSILVDFFFYLQVHVDVITSM